MNYKSNKHGRVCSDFIAFNFVKSLKLENEIRKRSEKKRVNSSKYTLEFCINGHSSKVGGFKHIQTNTRIHPHTEKHAPAHSHARTHTHTRMCVCGDVYKEVALQNSDNLCLTTIIPKFRLKLMKEVQEIHSGRDSRTIIYRTEKTRHLKKLKFK